MNLILSDMNVGVYIFRVCVLVDKSIINELIISFDIDLFIWVFYIGFIIYLFILVGVLSLWRIGVLGRLYNKFKIIKFYNYFICYEIIDGYFKFEKMFCSKECFINEIIYEFCILI